MYYLSLSLSLSPSLLNFEDKRRFDQRVSPHIVGFVPGLRHIFVSSSLGLSSVIYIYVLFAVSFMLM